MWLCYGTLQVQIQADTTFGKSCELSKISNRAGNAFIPTLCKFRDQKCQITGASGARIEMVCLGVLKLLKIPNPHKKLNSWNMEYPLYFIPMKASKQTNKSEFKSLYGIFDTRIVEVLNIQINFIQNFFQKILCFKRPIVFDN